MSQISDFDRARLDWHALCPSASAMEESLDVAETLNGFDRTGQSRGRLAGDAKALQCASVDSPVLVLGLPRTSSAND